MGNAQLKKAFFSTDHLKDYSQMGWGCEDGPASPFIPLANKMKRVKKKRNKEEEEEKRSLENLFLQRLGRHSLKLSFVPRANGSERSKSWPFYC